MDYDFQTLSPDDFERLVADLFSAEWGVTLESYKPGKDSGIDLLHSRTVINEPRTILQCKRYQTNAFPQLLNSFKKELGKIEKLKPQKYIVVTSVALSNANKLKLIETLKPWVNFTGDIYGQSEINTLLRKHDYIIRSHFKLWISSTSALEAIFHSKIFNLTHFTLDEMKNEMCKIVLHEGYDRALSTLKKSHHCIIAGNPGIGKTTLAKILLCHYAQEGFEPLVVHNDIGDAWALITRHQSSDNKKIAILYDDFLGQTRYDQLKFGKNEDTLLINLIKLAERKSNIRFILTSREYIIADARISHGVFDSNADSISKCTVNLSDYSSTHRARVLFNHLYFSNLPKEKIQAIVESKLYRTIIEHKHFNPRIISAISNKANSESLNKNDFLNYISAKFDNPAEIWDGPFNNDIMPLSRWILVTLWTMGGKAEIEKLKEAVVALKTIAFDTESALLFNKCLRELAENFITSEVYKHARQSDRSITEISFQNPSINEYIESFLRTETTWIKAISERSTFFTQLEKILTILESLPTTDGATIAQCLLARHNDIGYKPKGDTYRSSDGVLVFTDSDLYSEHDTTLTLLRISALTPDLGSQYEIEKTINTYNGWTSQLENLASRGSAPYSIRKLANWLTKSVYWEIHHADIKRAFYTAFTNCINSQPYWCNELSTLNILHECTHLFGIELNSLEKLKIQFDADCRAKEILDSEDNIQVLEETADHLEKFHQRMKFGTRQLIDDLREKADVNYANDEGARTDLDEAITPPNSEKLDIDAMFSELIFDYS